MERFPPKQYMTVQYKKIQKGQTLDCEGLCEFLHSIGYSRTKTSVKFQGEYSLLGMIIELYPFGYSIGFRIILQDIVVEHIYQLDANNNIIKEHDGHIILANNSWHQINSTTINIFKNNYRNNFEGNLVKDDFYMSVISNKYHDSLDHYFPLFFENTTTIFDYLNENALWCVHPDWQSKLDQRFSFINNCYSQSSHLYPKKPLKPEVRYVTPTNCIQQIGNPSYENESEINLPLTIEVNQLKDILISYSLLKTKPNVTCNTTDIKLHKTISDTLNKLGWEESIRFTSLRNIESFYDEEINYIYINLSNPFDSINNNDEISADAILHSLPQLKINDFIIHKRHGIGIYRGLVTMAFDDVDTQEFIAIEFSNQTSLYLPTHEYSQISFYAPGNQVNPPVLGVLHGSSFKQTYNKITKETIDYVAIILEQQSRRKLNSKPQKYKLDPHAYNNFLSLFNYQETEDQSNAIHITYKDMMSQSTMDRIICGDVGYGKTEIALRATFLAVSSGYSAIWIAPTSLLAEQHAETIKKRFINTTVEIFHLSRFAQNKLTISILDKIKNTSPSIIVGTHRVLNSAITPNKPSLLVIDEEHKFGVEHKTKLLEIHPQLDLLTMSATPIPRTLNLGITGLKDLSLISTPPPSRKPVITYCMLYDKGFIKEAIERELQRGGQIFIVHNKISTIDTMYDRIVELFPENKIAIAHGRMKSEVLETVMQQFANKEFDILITTTIIESGIDFPNANTLIVTMANNLSPVQLHQLRGRVGRSYQQAIAIFISDTKEGLKELEDIKNTHFNGAGFHLSLQDLEKRGAGEILGKKQSGNLLTLGTELYLEILSKAMHDLKENRTPVDLNTTIQFHEPAFIPESYCINPAYRLQIYRQISRCTKEDEINIIYKNIVKEYGDPPKQFENLILIAKIKLLANANNIETIQWSKKSINITFNNSASIHSKLIDLASKNIAQFTVTFHQNGSVSFNHQPLITAINHYNFFVEIIKLL
ncbi:MAG: helicase-related protein [Methylacidiphilales bacterium]|nr:helicase-related protein [Candidatus Methylacidiphilales bacterium]